MAHTPGPWEWWTSCSWKRLTSKTDDRWNMQGDVLCPVVCSDGHPDLVVSKEDMALIAAAPEIKDALQRALRQWAMYFEMHEQTNLASDPSTEGDLYRLCVTALSKAEGA